MAAEAGDQAGVALLLVEDVFVEDVLVSEDEPLDVPDELPAESDFDSVDVEPSPFDSDFESETFTVDDVDDSALRLSLR
ncbi:MAG TPA: hypothetical protein VK059_09975 [Nocardioidaceae bacterium]|nr:hypothetical protein [Nocardioidaceae bacterium]